MAFKKKNVEKIYRKYKECNPGEVLVEGIFERCVEDKYNKPNYEFRTEDNTIRVLNSSGHINYLLNEYAVFGDFCRITYEGMKLLEKGQMKGKDSHMFTLEIDDEKFDKSFARDNSKQSKRKNLETEKEPIEEIEEIYEEVTEQDLESMSL